MDAQDWSELDARARAVLARHGGIAHVSAFDEARITRRQLGALHARGVIERPRTGWFVDPALPWQVKRAVRVGGSATCVTAAELWGLPVPPGAHRVLHVLVEAQMTRLRHNRDRNRVLSSVDDDVEVELHRRTCVDAVVQGRTALVDTLLVLVACVSADWFVAALDAALHTPRGGTPLLSSTDLQRFSDLLPRRRRHLLDAADPNAESCLETLLRLALVRRGITDFVLQAQPHPRFRVDFLLAGRLIVEVDGATFHDAEQDRLRDSLLRALGYRVVRFGYGRIVTDVEAVVDEIQAELRLLTA